MWKGKKILFQPQETQSTYEITKHLIIWTAHIVVFLLWPNGVQLHDYFLYLDVVDGHLGCFYFLAIVNNAFINIHMHDSVLTYAFIALD